mmetsp:Transcript_14003/g.19356  ORF Transcript_14003/g.19356 Transcript_14003/m.19356 type:complete len:309 (+) Transcript_14003:1067-1993(+)
MEKGKGKRKRTANNKYFGGDWEPLEFIGPKKRLRKNDDDEKNDDEKNDDDEKSEKKSQQHKKKTNKTTASARTTNKKRKSPSINQEQQKKKKQVKEVGGDGVVMIQEGGGQQQQQGGRGLKEVVETTTRREDPIVCCHFVDASTTQTAAGLPQSSTIHISLSWFVNFCVVSKFEERLRWSWKNKRRAITGSFPLPSEVFDFFFQSVGTSFENEKRIKKIITKVEDLEKLDQKFGSSTRWRKCDFPLENGVEDGKNAIVLQYLQPCGMCWPPIMMKAESPLEIFYDKKTLSMKFSASVQGTNSTDAVRY